MELAGTMVGSMTMVNHLVYSLGLLCKLVLSGAGMNTCTKTDTNNSTEPEIHTDSNSDRELELTDGAEVSAAEAAFDAFYVEIDSVSVFKNKTDLELATDTAAVPVEVVFNALEAMYTGVHSDFDTDSDSGGIRQASRA
jgi:hypothetical protein